MKKLLGCALAVGMTVAAGVAPAQSAGSPAAAGHVKDKLIGAWRLAWVEEGAADGKTERVQERGVIMYTSDGHMAVQIMLPAPESEQAAGPVRYAQGGYEAYYGTYEVDEQAHTVTHHVEGALVRTLIGNNLVRVYQFSNGQLILKSSRADEHWTIAWEHY